MTTQPDTPRPLSLQYEELTLWPEALDHLVVTVTLNRADDATAISVHYVDPSTGLSLGHQTSAPVADEHTACVWNEIRQATELMMTSPF